MATGMKWWLGVTLTGMALTGYALLPPDGPAPPRPDRTTPEEAEASRILRETQEISAVLQRLRWMDSIPSMVVERSAHPGGFFVTAPEWAEPEDVETIRNEVAEEMARLPRLDPSMTVALVVQDRAHGTAPGMVPTPGSRVEVYAGFLHDRAYCVVLALVTRGPPSSSILPRWTRGNIERNGGRVGMLDACRVYAAFGPPGEHVDTWLRTGGVAYATLPSDHSDRGPDAFGVRTFNQGIMGIRFGWANTITPDGVRCAAGDVDGCRDVFLRPSRTDQAAPLPWTRRVAPRVSALKALNGGTRTTLGSASRFLLADLQDEFGPDRFRRFWTSDLPVEEAFAEAFGLEVGRWTASWVRENAGQIRATPRLPLRATASLFLVLALTGAVASTFAERRSVSG